MIKDRSMKLTKKLMLTITTLSALTFISAASLMLSTSDAKAETTECIEIVSLPAIITVQGIYCFKGNLVTGITSGSAINIQTNNVTIDMNGFKLGGSTAGAGTEAVGIYADERKNITIRNGSIRGFAKGIELAGFNPSGHLIEQIKADGNKKIGFQVTGDNNIIRNNHIINTGGSSTDDEAFGIKLGNCMNILVANNVVSNVFETLKVTGIDIASCSNTEIRGNSIFEMKDATSKYGVITFSSNEITFRKNQINNPSTTTGTTGIIDLTGNSTKVSCKGNAIVGYTTAIGPSACDLDVGNHNF